MDLYNFIIGKTKEERRGKGSVGEKSNSCLTNIQSSYATMRFQKFSCLTATAYQTYIKRSRRGVVVERVVVE
jgi:hypothetical protein